VNETLEPEFSGKSACARPPYLRRRKLQAKREICTRWNGADALFALSDAFMTSSDAGHVSIARRGRRRPGAIGSVCVLVAGIAAGCSMSDGVGGFTIDPGHYAAYHCDGLVARLKVLLAREQDLTNLMSKASEGPVGAVVGTLSYRADYENALGEEKVLRRAAVEKKCELPPPVSPTSPTPAAYSTPPAPLTSSVPPTSATVPIFQSDQTIR
jgi:hypothetical protein